MMEDWRRVFWPAVRLNYDELAAAVLDLAAIGSFFERFLFFVSAISLDDF